MENGTSAKNLSSSKMDRAGSGTSKIDPSFKSKRYRDKLRTEIKALECLIPVDRSVLHRKLDSQTVFRLVISYLKIKRLFKAISLEDKKHDTKETDKAETAEEDHDPASFFEGKNIFQILDGFMLAATTDGTILYASDNVLQYLGFNQVDLMHRCLYGVVHPDDHFDLKTVLEHGLPSLSTQDIESNRENGESQAEVMKYASFICRMKCFNGTSAGYLKIHCSGKIENIPDMNIKSNRNLPYTVLLYCQPFMLTGNDITYDVKQNVFWSKHDMDLTIRELDKKAEEIVGYQSTELNDLTLYQYVHPEDLVAFAACHKMLTESTEVQTMYFRMESKEGRWVWLHSRGKVISKNSKKFSIVFTHCPVREEDSTFLQQETSLRCKHAINDLQYYLQDGQYNTPIQRTDTDLQNEDIHGMQKVNNFCTPHMGFTEDVSLSFYSPLPACPSSWHSLSDRHSPVLPSTHVAHKITQREKQLQFQEFKRRQQLVDKHLMQTDYLHLSSYNGMDRHYYPATPQLSYNLYHQTFIKQEPGETIESTCFQNSHNHHLPKIPRSDAFVDNSNGKMQLPVHPPPPYPTYDHPVSYEFPPSPPMTPNKVPSVPQNYLINSAVPQIRYPTSSMSLGHSPLYCHPLPSNSNIYNIGNANNFPNRPNTYQTGYIPPHTNIKMSLHYDKIDQQMKPLMSDSPCHYRVTSGPDQSCSVTHNICPPRERVEYDIEASIHMKIVENPYRRSSGAIGDVDLPSIGSFLEYLNDS